MEGHHQEPSRDSFDSLALARKHVRALTDGGLSREALLRALLEQEEANNSLPPLPAQGPPQPQQLQQLKNSTSSLSRSLSLAQPKSRSHWSVSTHSRILEEGDRPPSPGQLSTSSAAHSATGSGSRGSFLSTHTTATSLSDRSSTITQFPGNELAGSKSSSASTRAYWCTSCDTEFKRKFDWKRHEDEFHERYKKYPCPDCNRVFWGANTFNQHHKTRHNCKTCPHADKVIKYTRKKRAWACGFCAAFLPSMDRYIDHIGLHYESGRTKAHWYHSNVIYGLLHQPGINTAWKNIIGSRFSHIPKEQQPCYGWDAKTTGRKQGFLENETAGNLQDLLEFFNPTKDDPANVASLAFDFAELTPATQSPRNSLEGPNTNKAPQPPPPPPPGPKREKSVAATTTTRRAKPKDLAPAPAGKDRPVTAWPGFHVVQQDMHHHPDSTTPGVKPDVQMADYQDNSALPPPLFAAPQQYSHHQAPPSISAGISPASDQPTFLTPTTPLSQTASPYSTLHHQQSRDTVVDLLTDYMSQDAMPQDNNSMHDMQQHHHQQRMSCQQQPQHQQQQFTSYDDWNSICSTMVDDVSSPRHNGPGPLPPAPQHAHARGGAGSRRSDFWASGDHDSMYVDDQQQLPPPPLIHDMENGAGGRRSDVWASSAGQVDYEGLGYDEEIAAPPPPSANWL